MSWFADILQNPMRKAGTAVVLKGTKGCGKSIVFDMFRKVLGRQNSTKIASRDHLTGKFNQHLMTALFAQCEEAVWGGSKDAEGVLKDRITGDTLMIEPKGINSFEVKNYTRYGFTTNEQWAIPATADERRFFVLECMNTKAQDTDYFSGIVCQMEQGDGLEAWAHALMNWKKPDWVDLRKPPRTLALGEQVLESLSAGELFFYEEVVSGRLFDDEPKEVWKSDLYGDYAEFCQKRGAKFDVSDQRFGTALSKVWGLTSQKRRNPRMGKSWDRVYVLPSWDDAKAKTAKKLNLPVEYFED